MLNSRAVRWGVPFVIFAALFIGGVAAATFLGSQYQDHDTRVTMEILLGAVAGFLAVMATIATWMTLND